MDKRELLAQMLKESMEDAVACLKELFPHGYSKWSDTAFAIFLFLKRAEDVDAILAEQQRKEEKNDLSSRTPIRNQDIQETISPAFTEDTEEATKSPVSRTPLKQE